MAAGIYLTEHELHALAGLPHAAIALYLALRRRMDFRTAIVGAPVGLSWQALVEDLYIEPHSGPMPGSPGREAVRRLCAWLVRAQLVQYRSNAAQAQLMFRLPLAKTFSRAQNQPDRNPTGEPDRGRSETLSTGTRQGTSATTRQTSGNQGLRAPAAAASNSSYQPPAEAELIFPEGTSRAEVRAFGAICTKHRLTRDQAQLLLDELRGMKAAKAQVRNGAALLNRMAQQLAVGEFFGVKADQARGGGAGLSAEEARFINEGGNHVTD